MSYRTWNYAKCPSCGHEVAHDRDDTFICRFFLPKICSECGEYRGYSWVHVTEKQKFRKIEAEWKRPSTWFKIGEWETVERSEREVGF